MRENRKLIAFALISIVVTLALSMLSASVLEPYVKELAGVPGHGVSTDLFWIHVVTTTFFAAIAVLILSGLAIWLLRRVRGRERELQAREQLLRTFSADAAHELRTPLAVLRAQIESMEDTTVAKSMLQDVDQITHIIEQILDKSRFDVLHVAADEKADLSQVCTGVVSYLAPLIIKEGRSIEVIGTEQPVIVRGNAFALEQAMKNLISNATKYSARGTTITVEVTDGPAVHVMDHGRGVPIGERESIFKRFHRVDRRGGGAGLGLAIVKSVAEAHGGRIEVGDVPTGGAVFTLHLNRPSRPQD